MRRVSIRAGHWFIWQLSQHVYNVKGAMAEAYYGIPEEIKQKAIGMLPDDLLSVIEERYLENY